MNSNNTKSFLDEYKEYISLFPILFYLWGTIYYISFFHAFNINITAYLQIHELLLGAIVLLFKALLPSTPIFILFALMKILNQKRGFRGNLFSSETQILISILAIALISMSLFFFVSNLTVFWIFILAIIPSVIYGLKGKGILPTKIIIINKGYSIMILLFAFIPALIALEIAKDIKENKSGKSFEIFLNDGTVYSSCDSISFIDETSSAVFLFDTREKKTIIINRNSINICEIYKDTYFGAKAKKFIDSQPEFPLQIPDIDIPDTTGK